jgi:multicomponent Na+:H+ antiporter subunit D
VASLAPLAVVVPILAATVVIAGGRHVPRALGDGVALLSAAATTTLCALLLAHVWGGREVYWFGGWHPRQGHVAIGIDLAVDPLGAGAATFASLLVTFALVYSQRYFEAVTPLWQGLMLIFLAGMVGFSLTGDLFNLFVFFELMSAPAYALTGYKVEEEGPIQGALTFAITTSIGAFMTLGGIGLLYGRTGALNLAQIGAALAGGHADGLVIVAFVLVVTGLLVKSAIVPFHFWLADAHAVAPFPVCVLFSGVMVQLGLLAIARVYWTVFAGQPQLHDSAFVSALTWLGVVTALLGALMAFLQSHLKRLLAFSTISHSGMFLVGLATLSAHGLGGAAVFVLAHGFTKAALFMLAGIVAHRLGSVALADLFGRGGRLRVTGPLFAVAGLALASLPPFGPFLGKSLVEEAAADGGYGWMPVVFVVASALAGGAILRAAMRIFLGMGERPRPAPGRTDEEGRAEEPETERDHDRTPALMMVPAVLLLVAGIGLAFVPHLKAALDRAAARFEDRAGYAAQVLHGQHLPAPPVHVATGPHASSYAYAAASVLGALLVTFSPLYVARLRAALPRLAEPARATGAALHAWHSGHIGDYVTWLVVGVVVIGWTMGIAVR